MVFGLLVTTACGGNVDHAGAAAGAAAAGGGGSGASPSVGGGEQGGDGIGGEGAGPVCGQYESEPSAGAVQFVLTNARPTSVYIGDGACIERYQIVVGGELQKADMTEFDVTCVEVEQNPYYPLDCDSFGTVEIAPGATAALTWPGLVYQHMSLPAACAADPNNPFAGSCLQGFAADSSMLAIQIALSGSLEGENFSVTQSFAYPASGPVAISIEP